VKNTTKITNSIFSSFGQQIQKGSTGEKPAKKSFKNLHRDFRR